LRRITAHNSRVLGGCGGGGAGADGRGFNPGIFGILAAFVLFVWAASGIYVVRANENAVIQTFGAWYPRDAKGPGLHYRLPWPIQKHTKLKVTEIQQTAIGGTESAHKEDESLMVTGDKDIVDIQFTVQWRIERPGDFMFNLRDPQGAITAVAESAMREVVGRMPLQPIITTARGQIQTQVADLMQRVLDSYGAGVSIVEVQINGANPPQPVMEAFRDVQAAQQDAEAAANRARGEAARITQQAVGAKALAIQGAEGEAAAFNQIYGQYKLAPAITRQRLYIETMEKVLQNSQKIIVDNKGASAPIILPPDAFRPRAGVQNNVMGPSPVPPSPPRGRQ
jgi:membrane protease subunit HflK